MSKTKGIYINRIISFILIMSVLLIMTPVRGLTVAAAVTHNHSGWTEWTSTNSLPNTAGSYYLTGDVSGSWTAPSGTVDLCLNGNTISGGITVPSGATLNIYDEGSGKVKNSGKAVLINSGGKVHIYGGIFETTASSGRCIEVESGGFIQIDSGTINGAPATDNATILIKGEGIINNATVSGGSNAVYSQNSGKTYIYGGNFNSKGFNSMAIDPGAYMYINMTNGGVISNDVSGHYAINVLGTAEIDYAITSGSSTAINVNSGASATINGGSFNSTSNDTVTNKGTLTITGGSFTGKQYAVNNSGTAFKLSGSPKFTGSTADIYLASSKKITIAGTLGNTTPYSVSTASTPTKSSSVEFTNSSTTSYNDKTKFTPVNSSYIVRKNSSDQLELAVLANPCTVTFDFKDGVTEAKTVIYESGDTYGTLPAPPTRNGYKFEGWYTQPDGEGTKIETTDTVDADLTLYAYWTAENTGSGNTGDGSNTGGENTGSGSTGGSTGNPSQPPAGTIIPSTGNGNNTADDTDDNGDNTEDDNNGDDTDGETGDDNNGGSSQPSADDSNDPSDDTSAPSTGDNTDTSDENDTGNVTVNSESDENAPDVTISEETSSKLKEEVIAEHLTPEEKAAVENGASLDIILSVEDAGETVSTEDKQAAEAVLNDTEYTVGMYLNIDLLKLINGQHVGNITEINSPIHVTIEVPDELQSSNREFVIVRIHNGKAEILEDIDDDTDTITIATDKFSTYSIAYKDTEDSNPSTGRTAPVVTIALTGAVIMAAVVVKKKKIV